MITLKKFENQNVIILGDYPDDIHENVEELIRIDDDYSGFGIRSGNDREKSIETAGFAVLITIEDLVKYKQEFEDSEYFDPESWGFDEEKAILIENFTGEIKLEVKDEDDKDISSEINIDDYIQHQGEVSDICVVLPESTKFEIMSIDKLYKRLKPLFRDLKIESIVK